MVSTKLPSLINLIKKHGTVESINQLKRLAVQEDTCAPKTVTNLVPELKKQDNIRHERVKNADQFTYVEMSEKKNFAIHKELDLMDNAIKDHKVVIKRIKAMSKLKFTQEKSLDLMSIGVAKKREIMRLQQRLVHFDACSFVTRPFRERFEITKKNIVKLDLDLHKAIFKADPETVGNVFNRTDYELSLESHS